MAAGLTAAVLVVLAVAGGMSSTYAQERGYTSLDVQAEVTHVSRELGTFADQWTFIVDIANTDTEPLLVDVGYLYLDDGSWAPTDCVDRLELRPGQTGELVGCFRVGAGLEPVSIDFVGSSNKGDPIPVHALPFVRGECDAFADTVSCQSVQDIAGIIREVEHEDSAALLAHAVYSWTENKLVLNFTEKINPFVVRVDHIRIASAACSLTLSHDEYDAHAPDLRSITLKLSESSRAALAGMAHPHVYAKYGALAALNWTHYPPSDIPLSADGPAPEGQPCVVTYGFVEPPAAWLESAGINTTYATVVKQAVSDGFGAWTALNPGLLLAEAEENPVIEIRWIEYDGGTVGWACFDCIGDDAFIEVVIHETDCNGDPVLYGPNSIRNTIAHEFGHNIGLEHHPNWTHLMAGGDFVQDPFDTRGYVIPEPLPERPVGEDGPGDRLYLLDLELDRLEAELKEMVDEAMSFADRHATGMDGDKVHFETDQMLNKYEEMLDRIDAHKEEYDALIDELTTIIREENCMDDLSDGIWDPRRIQEADDP